MILENTLKKASKILKENNINSHELDAEIILSHLMGVTKEFLITNNDTNIPKSINRKYEQAIKRRIKKEPVAYIIGKKEFWSESFIVNNSTLVPRPETEIMIYKIAKFFKDKKINVLDIGTGSGCILLSILKELNCAKGIGIDISKKAVATARINAIKLGLNKRAKFKIFDMKNFFYGKYDLIVSNPPYILLKDIKNLDKDIINYEPLIALNGGIDGLDLIKKVIYKSKKLLKTNGMLVIEIGNQQYLKVSNLLKMCRFREISKEYDYKRNVRCIISTKV